MLFEFVTLYKLTSSQSSGLILLMIWIHLIMWLKGVDPGRLASSETRCSGFTLFSKNGYRIVKK